MSQETLQGFKARQMYVRLINKELKDEPFTNADHIRMMSDDELADFLDKTDPVYWTRDIWANWLKEEWHES